MESCESEHSLLISFWAAFPIAVPTSRHNPQFSTVASAIKHLLPLLTYLPYFFRDCEKWDFPWQPQKSHQID